MNKVGPALPFTVLLSAACATTPNYHLASLESASAASGESGSAASGSDSATAAGAPAGAAAGTAAPLATQDGEKGIDLAQEARNLELARQKNALMLEQHIANGRSFIGALRYEDAERELLAALTIDPANGQAKQLLNEVTALMGKSPAGATIQDMQQRQAVRVQQMQAAARDSLDAGRKHLARGDYGRAIAELSIAKNHIRWAPYSIDWQGMDKEVDDLLDKATKSRVSQEQRLVDEKNEDALRALRERQLAEDGRREAIIANVVSQAIEAFEATEYDDAIDLCDQALQLDPRNEKATEVRDAAFRIGRERVRTEYIAAKVEKFKRWREELANMRIPETEIYTLPDAKFWAEITERRSKRRGLTASGGPTQTDLALRAQLSATRIPGLKVADEDSLGAVIDILRTFTGLPLVVDPAAETAASDAGKVFTFDLTTPITVEQALSLICREAGDEGAVTWTVRHDTVLVTTKLKARAATTILNHDVQDLVFGLTDFPGPRIDRLRLLDDMEDEDGGGPFGSPPEIKRPVDVATLATLIKENVEVGTWEEEGVTLTEGEGFLVIVHTPEVQEKVQKFLNDLRRFQSSLVTIESKFMSVSSNWIQEIGVDFRGIDNPIAPFKDLDDVTNGLDDQASRGLDNGGLGAASGTPSSGVFYNDGADGQFGLRTENFFGTPFGDNGSLSAVSRPLGSALSTAGGITTQLTFLNDLELSAILRAVEKNADFQLINTQILSVHNTQRSHVAVINQRAFIQDFDVEVAQFSAVADPQINVLHEGVVLDVRPTIHHNRKYLTLEIQPTVAKVVALRPFSTTLGGNTLPVIFELPELEVQSLFTSAVIPDGGSLLLGGLSNIRNVERRAEVPWLAKLPLVGFLLKQEGYSDENKSLMIVIRASITDARDKTEELENRMR
jgi:type II secretory pathway component GspD/PulD (secretin)/tetratricopeptide (TPR) repeat protein